MRKALLTFTIIIACLVGIYSYLHDRVSGELEAYEIKRDDPSFTKLPTMMRDFAITNASNEPIYSFSSRDGERTPSGDIHYVSTSDIATIQQEFSKSAKRHDCIHPEKNEPISIHKKTPTLSYVCFGHEKKGSLSLYLEEPAADTVKVSVVFIGSNAEFEQIGPW